MGGGVMSTIADKASEFSGADKTSAALVAQAAQSPSSYTPPAQPSYAPITVAAMQPSRAPTQPTAPSTVFTGANPYRQAGSTTLSTAQRPTLSMPGMQGVQNPFYTAPHAPTSQAPQVSALASQYQTYQQQQANQLAAAAAQRQANAYAAQQAYETARGNTALRGQYEGTINALNSQVSDLQNQLSQAQAQANQNSGNWGWYTGASGGIASLTGKK